MIELTDEFVIRARARLAQALADRITASTQVYRWHGLSFADDGGALIVVELYPGLDAGAAEVIARELEVAVGRGIRDLPWVRVQVVFQPLAGGPNL